MLLTLTMWPLRCLSITGSSYFMHSHTPLRFTSMVRCQFSSVHSAVGAGRPSIPALLKAQSMRPKRSRVVCTRRATSSPRDTSHLTKIAGTP